jgi:hypothetical protein
MEMEHNYILNTMTEYAKEVSILSAWMFQFWDMRMNLISGSGKRTILQGEMTQPKWSVTDLSNILKRY